MLAILSVFPLGARSGRSLAKPVSEAVDEIMKSGLDYRVTSMGTLIEGDWDAVMRCVKRIRTRLLKRSDRLYFTLAVDERGSGDRRIRSKVDAVETALKKPVKR